MLVEAGSEADLDWGDLARLTLTGEVLASRGLGGTGLPASNSAAEALGDRAIAGFEVASEKSKRKRAKARTRRIAFEVEAGSLQQRIRVWWMWDHI